MADRLAHARGSEGVAEPRLSRSGVCQRGLKRRDFLSSALAFATASKAWGAASHRSLDPVNPDILFGTTSSMWRPQHDTVWAVKRVAALGLQGIELYADGIEKYRKNPLELKK